MTPPFDEPTGDDDAQDIPDWLADGDLDSDDAIAWLEELAAKYDPNFESSASVADDVEEEEEALPDTMLVSDSVEPGDEDVPDWLREEPERKPEPTAGVTPSGQREAGLPDWLLEDEEEAPEEEPAVPAAAPAASAAAKDEDEEQEDLFDWLRQPLSVEEDEGLPDWLLDEEDALEARTPAAAAVDDDEEDEEDFVPSWLREEPAREPQPDAAIPPARAEAQPAKPGAADEADEDELSPEQARAFAWLDQQVSEQGVDAGDVVSEALTADRPPVEQPAVPDPDAVAEPVSDDDLPDWLRGVGAKAEADEAETEASLDEELEELVRVAADEDELAWLESALEAESEFADDDELAELFAEAAKAGVEFDEEAEPAAQLPKPPSELPAPEGADALSLPEGEREEKKPIRLTGPTVEGEPIALGASAAETDIGFNYDLLDDEELPDWLKDMEADLLPAEATAEGEDEELPDWLKEPEPREAPVETEPAAEAAVQKDVPQVPWPEAEAEAEAEEEEAAEAEVEVEEPVAEIVELVPADEEEAEEEPEPAVEPAAEEEPEPAATPPALEEAADEHDRLRIARERLNAKDIAAALPHYEELVASGEMLEQTVADMSYAMQTEAKGDPRIRRIWGDALRAQGKLQEALDVYRQALDEL